MSVVCWKQQDIHFEMHLYFDGYGIVKLVKVQHQLQDVIPADVSSCECA